MFINKYRCVDCGHRWDDNWDSMCEDKCPHCGTTMTPYESIEVENLEFDNQPNILGIDDGLGMFI